MRRFDPVSFAFGIVFLFVAAVAALDLPTDVGTWAVPAALIGIGTAIGVATLAGHRRP